MNKRLIKYIKEEFELAISRKTGWGKNEIIQVYDQAVVAAMVRLMDEDKND